jgi:endonuclease/exonuclease/phosphatase family metal-dependent hydrolase
MKHLSPRLLALVATVLACSAEPTPASTQVVIDSFNVGLAGAFIPFEPQRRAAVGAAIAQMPSDIVCIQEAWREEDKDAIVAATRTRFPHVARARHDLESTVTAGFDLDPMCPVAPARTGAPCASMALRAALDEGLQCLARSCSTMPGSEMGQTTSTACAASMCVGQVGALITSTEPDALRCYGCLATALPTETIGSIRGLCTANANAGLAFGGRSGVMILSRHPLSEVETVVIPGTWNRRVITRATASLPSGRRVAVYCNHLSPVFNGVTFPYTGRHGCDRIGAEGWATEQLAQARRLVTWVNQTAGTTPAVVLGDFNTSPMGVNGITPEAPDTYNYLRMQLTPAQPQGYVPRCTYCPDNALNGMRTDPVWIDHIFLKNLTTTAVRSYELTFTDASVVVPAAPGRVHLSDHYGVRATLTLP